MKKTFLALSSSLFFILFAPLTQANIPASFGVEYGLNLPQDGAAKPIFRGTALEVLSHFFPEYPWPADLDVNDSDSVCEIDFLNCKVFFPQASLDQKMFLSWWSALESPKAEFKNAEEGYLKTWYHMRSWGWLPIVGKEVTYADLQEILYRYQTSEFYGNLPYRLGMVLDVNEINAQNYPKLFEVDQALKNLEQMMNKAALTEGQWSLLTQTQQKFTQLREELYQAKHPFNVVPHELPEDIRQKITENNLGEVLAQVSYNYSKDISGRRHNVLTGLQEISGRVYRSGETINYFDVLKENGLRDYAMAYNLVGGISQWGYGGGLCGATTIVFQTLLNSGVFRPGDEGVVRSNHSALYLSLYPTGSLGKDAVMYFNSRNLIVKNHFDSTILFYAHNDADKKEVTLYLFGNSPYEYVTVSDAEKTGHNRYRVNQTLKPYNGPEETRHLDSYYPGGIR